MTMKTRIITMEVEVEVEVEEVEVEAAEVKAAVLAAWATGLRSLY